MFVDHFGSKKAHFEIVPLPDDWVGLKTEQNKYLAVSSLPLQPLNLTKKQPDSRRTQFRIYAVAGGFALFSRKTEKWVAPTPGFWANGTGLEPTPFRIYRMPSFEAARVCECTEEERERGLKWVQRRTIAITTGVVVGAMIVSVAAAPAAVAALGFGAAGIEAGSVAAGMMSSAAIAEGGAIAAGSLVAILQSIGAAGMGAGAAAAVATVGAAAGASATAAVYLAQGSHKDCCPLCEGVTPQADSVRHLRLRDFQLILAVEEDEVGDVETLISAGANVALRYIEGATLLHIAAARNSLKVVPYLLGRIDVNARDSNECTALWYAATKEHREMMDILLGSGASRAATSQSSENEEQGCDRHVSQSDPSDDLQAISRL